MRSVVALTEEGVSAIQTRVGDFGDEKLRAIGIGTSVGVGQASGAVEFQGRRSLVLEFKANIAAAAAGGIATLNHEVGNHAVKDGAVIERDTVFFGVRDGVGPVFGALGQADEIGHADRGLVGEQGAGQLAGSGVDDGGGPGRCGGRRFGSGGRGWLFRGSGFGGGRGL